MINILFHNLDVSGVAYWRTVTPATVLNTYHTDFNIGLLNKPIDYNSNELIAQLSQFDAIHYHRSLLPIDVLLRLKNTIPTKFVLDIDDYWRLSPNHPMFNATKGASDTTILDNIRAADYISCTTEYLAREIRTISGRDNVYVFPNSIDPAVMPQFVNNHTPSTNGKVRITVQCGSSHEKDIDQLYGVFNRLYADYSVRDKFTVTLAGWDTRGSVKKTVFNIEFGNELRGMNLWDKRMVALVNATGGNVDKLPLPNAIKEKYRGKVFSMYETPLKPEQSVYFNYEKILTDNYRIVDDPIYVSYLKSFVQIPYPNQADYIYNRVWTRPANEYAYVLDSTDILLIPLVDNMFNRCKSELKLVEAISRNLPVVVSEVVPYSPHTRHAHNAMCVPSTKNQGKYWYKYIKELVLNPDMRTNIGNQLREDLYPTFNAVTVSNDRAEFYRKINS